jgi:hypothetical protein
MVGSSHMRTKHSSAEVKMDCEHLGDTLGDQLINSSDITKCEMRTNQKQWLDTRQPTGWRNAEFQTP